MDLSGATGWWIVAGVLVAAELATGTFYLLMLALGAAAAALAAHLAIAFCRCMNIPARYCTGYLGDMGTEPPYGTMDFAGWFEAYLGDRWYTFDARNNTPRIGRVLIARGRDACDVALSSTFVPNRLERFKVWADEVKVVLVRRVLCSFAESRSVRRAP